MSPRIFEINETDRDRVKALLTTLTTHLEGAEDAPRDDHDDGLATVRIPRGDVADLLVRLDEAVISLSWLRASP